MEEGRKTKLLEEKLIASMKTEITLLKKLKHLASHRSDREGGCKSRHCSSPQSSLQSSASDITMTPWLNGIGTHVDRRKRAGGSRYSSNGGSRCGRQDADRSSLPTSFFRTPSGPVHQSGLTVQPSSVIHSVSRHTYGRMCCQVVGGNTRTFLHD